MQVVVWFFLVAMRLISCKGIISVSLKGFEEIDKEVSKKF